MKRLKGIGDYVTTKGSASTEGVGRTLGHVIGRKIMVTATIGESAMVIAVGDGRVSFDVDLLDGGQIGIMGDGLFSFTCDHWVSGEEPGWRSDESYTQLDLKDRNTVSPEVQAVLDAMNRNALIREAHLREEIARLSER